ncbi:MAG: Gfo/Idh/MocA family protein [Ktedonobacteraceae bacterium]
MTRPEPIRAGLIGYGIGKVYAVALQSVALYYAGLPPVQLVAVATASAASGKHAIEEAGFERYTTDYRELLASDDLDIVVIATPHYLHREMLLAALPTSKALYTDKPLANNLSEAHEIVALARMLGRDAQLSFTLRYCPAVRYAKVLLQEGGLGNIYSFRLSYYRSSYRNPEKSLRWKADKAKSGGGVLSDLVPHLADLLVWLVGIPERIVAQTRTFIRERPVAQDNSESIHVETDDHVLIQAALPGGAIGTIEAGRLIAGAISNVAVEIYGSKGSLRWNLMDPNYLYVADGSKRDGEQGWRQIPTVQDFSGAIIPDVPVGGMRFTIAAFADFFTKMLAGQPYDPGLEQGLRVQEIIEMAAESARAGIWVARPEERN